MQAKPANLDLGPPVASFQSPSYPYLWIGAIVVGILALLCLGSVRSIPSVVFWGMAALMGFLPIALYYQHRRLAAQRYDFFKNGFVMVNGPNSVPVQFSDLVAVWAQSVTTIAVPVAVHNSSLQVESSDGRKFKMSAAKLGTAASKDFQLMRQLLINAVTSNVSATIKSGKQAPWTNGLAIGRGLVIADGTEIPWPNLRFSILQGQCTIYGPQGRIAKVPAGAKNSIVVFQLAKANGTEFEYPRSSFSANKKPTAAAQPK